MVDGAREPLEEDGVAWLQLVAANTPDAITILSPDGLILYANHLAGRRDPRGVIGLDSAELVPLQHQPRWRATLQAALETRKTQTLEITSVSGFSWLSRLVPIVSGNRVSSVLCLGSDLSDLRRAQSELARKDQELRTALDASQLGLWRWNFDTNELVCDERARQLFGLPDSGKFDRRAVLETLHDADRARVVEAIDRMRKSGEWEDLVRRVVYPDGSVGWVLSRGKVLKDASGHTTGMLGGVMDITQTKHLEEQLRQSQKLEAVGQLAAGVAHDFNNLITAILMNVEVALTDPKEAQDAMESVQLAADRAAELTKRLLVFTRQQPFQPEPLSMNGLLRDLMGMLKRLLPETIQVELDLGEPLPLVFGDHTAIEQVVSNLCLNARDAMQNGGKLLVSTTAAPAAESGEAEHFVCLRIEDTGIGMTAAVRDRVFEPFFTTKEPGKGTGLGLSVVHGVIQQHHGRIDIDSEPGVGTTVTVYLPVSQVEARPVERPAAPKQQHGRETILVAEDDDLVRDAIVNALTRAGHEVLACVDGVEAMAVFAQRAADIALVVVDGMMPRKGGIEVYREVRELKPHQLVILSSGYSEAWPETYATLPGLRLLQKPYTPAALLGNVRELLDETIG